VDCGRVQVPIQNAENLSRAQMREYLDGRAPMRRGTSNLWANCSHAELVLSTDLLKQLQLALQSNEYPLVRASPKLEYPSSRRWPKQTGELGQIRLPKSSVGLYGEHRR